MITYDKPSMFRLEDEIGSKLITTLSIGCVGIHKMVIIQLDAIFDHGSYDKASLPISQKIPFKLIS